MIDKDPTIYLSPEGGGVPQKDRIPLTDEQVERLLEATRGLPPYLFVMLGLYAGLRREEILALKWDSVYLDLKAPYDTYWYDISTKEKLDAAIKTLKREIEATALQLEAGMEKNNKEAVKTLFEKHFEDYNVKLEYVADVLGMDAIVQKAHSIVDALSEEEKQEISDYKNGKRTKQWMMNPTNLRFIADHNLME